MPANPEMMFRWASVKDASNEIFEPNLDVESQLVAVYDLASSSTDATSRRSIAFATVSDFSVISPSGVETVQGRMTSSCGFPCDPDLPVNCDNRRLRDAVSKLASYLGKLDYPRGPASFYGWQLHPQLRLRGGAGAAADANTNGSSGGGSGWNSGNGGGAPAWNQPPPPPQGQQGAQWGASAQGNASSNVNSTSWAQAAGKGLPNNAAPNANQAAPNAQAAQPPPSGDSQQQKRELEKIREALYATDGWGGNHVNQDSDWSVPPSPPRSPGSENHQSWKANPNSTGTELWETNLRNGGVAPPRPAEMSSSVKPSWGRHGNNNDFGGQWDPEDDNIDVNPSWNTPPPPTNQWGGQSQGPAPAGAPLWGAKDKSGVDWANPGAGNTGWAQPPTSGGNRWGGKPPMGQPWGGGGKSWGDENTPPGGKSEDGTGMWGDANARKPDRNLGRGGMPPGAGGPMRVPPGVRPPGRWGDDGGADQSWGVPPSSPPNVGNAPGGWGQKPKSGMGWGDSGDMMGGDPGWGGHKQGPQKVMGKDMWKSQYGMYKDDSGMGMGRGMDEMSDMGHGGYPGHRDPTGGGGGGDVGMGMPGGASGPGGWPTGPGGRMDDHHGAGGPGFGAGPGAGNPYDMGGGLGGPMMHGGPGAAGMNPNRGPGGSGFPGQMQQNMQPFMPVRGGGGMRPGAPSSQQLHLLVNQIHMAVQAGHLNPQILNQKLSSQTLVLLHELLSQIKVLQTLTQQQQQAMQQSHMRGAPNPSMLQISVKITQTKQQIQNLQNQINAQQGIFTKAQHGGGAGGAPGMMMGPGDAGGFQKFPGHGGMGSVPGGGMPGGGGHDVGGGFSSIMGSMNLNANAMGMNMGPGAGGGGPVPGADMSGHGGMDHPAPGMPPSSSRFFNDWRLAEKRDDVGYGSEFSRAPGTMPSKTDFSTPAPGGMLGAPTDGTWATPASKVESGGWPDATSAAPSSSSSATATTTSANYVPDVPEFEPGKPWKGNQLMKNIEDDPTITPGSVKRSPLSVAGIKEPELNMKSSGASSTSADTSTTTTMAKTSNGSSVAASGWNYPSNRSTWLVLNNLSPNVDGSMLKTLCSQHGPLSAFQLMAHQGMALVRYSSYEEAAKAQCNLHNCALGSTSIRAEFVSDAEVQAFLNNPHGMQPQQQQQQGPGQGQQHPPTSWSNATVSQAQAISRSHDATWGQPGLAAWSGAGSNPSSLWDRVDNQDPSHSYLPENLI